MITSVQALKQLKPELQNFFNTIQGRDIENLILDIKKLESKLSEIKNAHTIKSKLSKARRALVKKQDRDKASGEWLKAIDLLDDELIWRAQAEIKLLPALTQLDQVIKNSIGLRLQQRLSIDNAEQVAVCLARHKDVSLAF